MTHPIIKTDNYLLVVDESEIKKGDYFICGNINSWNHTIDLATKENVYDVNEIFKIMSSDNFTNKNVICKKIIFHLPLNNAPTLEGVPLLPPLEDDEYDFAEIFYNICKATIEHFDDWVEAKDYNKSKTKEEYKYTEEDILGAIEIGYQRGLKHDDDNPVQIIHIKENFIQSLQQPKYPVAFECDVEGYKVNGMIDEATVYKPKTITNSQGLTQIVGKYIY